jgi:hypothetical protein
MRFALSSITVVALLAAAAGPAAARLDGPINVSPVTHHVKAAGIQGRQFRHLGGDVAIAAKVTRAPAVVVATPAVTDNGFDWADAGIGAGLAAALLLTAAGLAAVRRQHPTKRHAATGGSS